MKKHYKSILYKIVAVIAIILVILIDYEYINSLKGFYSLLTVFGLIWVFEQTYKTFK
jgi:hypothetical protein